MAWRSSIMSPCAPASTARVMTWLRKAWSARVASSAMNSTSSVSAAHAATVAWMEAAIPSAFLRNRYSICAGLTDAWTCRRGRGASFTAAHTAWMLSSSSSATGTASTLFLTMDATDLMRRESTLGFWMPSISTTEAPRRSSSFAISSFSLKVSDSSLVPAACFMVTSLTRTSLIGLSFGFRFGQFVTPALQSTPSEQSVQGHKIHTIRAIRIQFASIG